MSVPKGDDCKWTLWEIKVLNRTFVLSGEPLHEPLKGSSILKKGFLETLDVFGTMFGSLEHFQGFSWEDNFKTFFLRVNIGVGVLIQRFTSILLISP